MPSVTPTPWDGRSLVGGLRPPLKGGWPLRTPPVINIPSLSAKPWNGSGLGQSVPCDRVGDAGKRRHQGVSQR